nr:hypothetical protein [Tanacetum cinerariifolium]
METKDTLSSCSNSEEQQMQQIQDKAKEICMVSFRQLHSHLKLLLNNDLQGTQTEYGFKRAFATLFGQDLKTFTGTMFLNIDQLNKQLDKEEFQEIRSMAAFKSIDKRAPHKREYDSWVNERQMQTTKEKDTSSRSRNDAHDDDADIKPIYDEESMAEEKRFAIAALKNELRKLTGNDGNTKFGKSSILGKLVLQPHRNQSVVRQPTAFKSERPIISKPRFASQVDVNNDLPRPVTTYYFPRERESAFGKPDHMIAPSSSRYTLNDMVHNHYLEEAKKKIQKSSRNSKTSVMPSARSQSTTNGSKPKSRSNTQTSRNWPVHCLTPRVSQIKCAHLHGSALLSTRTRKFNPNRSIHSIRASSTVPHIKKLTARDREDFMAIGAGEKMWISPSDLIFTF